VSLNLAESALPAQKLGIRSPRHLADILKIPPDKLEEVAVSANVLNPLLNRTHPGLKSWAILLRRAATWREKTS
jgi:hypothetical protein